jgi:hypothetical protein
VLSLSRTHGGVLNVKKYLNLTEANNKKKRRERERRKKEPPDERETIEIKEEKKESKIKS